MMHKMNCIKVKTPAFGIAIAFQPSTSFPSPRSLPEGGDSPLTTSRCEESACWGSRGVKRGMGMGSAA